MATIYMIDNIRDNITIKKVVNTATAQAFARGMLHVRFEGKHHINDLQEYWADGFNWLHFADKQVYCLVTSK